MFLRGYGSQAITVDYKHNAGGLDNHLPIQLQTFSSGALGQVQADAMRSNTAAFGPMLSIEEDAHWLDSSYRFPIWEPGGWYYSAYAGFEPYSVNSNGSLDALGGLIMKPTFEDRLYLLNHPPKKYRLESSGGGMSDDGTASPASYTLVEEDDYSVGYFREIYGTNMGYRIDVGIPSAHEVRPVNVPVRYFIKAR